ncbi:hypothetical protein L211DRAFT_702763 [Terfezia boudieri ATCC MYA-4762]|uniref:Uncharacterized protein n=1 Tax=Terfezia boudieri ATCC MYA-4762 TaxID=1051890 RepID=A0A3N4LTN2_9PEZI|nr:hypothetical protein L211DRAFT_702763 [Terfezia boudieri ATCC MYA-4762]
MNLRFRVIVIPVPWLHTLDDRNIFGWLLCLICLSICVLANQPIVFVTSLESYQPPDGATRPPTPPRARLPCLHVDDRQLPEWCSLFTRKDFIVYNPVSKALPSTANPLTDHRPRTATYPGNSCPSIIEETLLVRHKFLSSCNHLA